MSRKLLLVLVTLVMAFSATTAFAGGNTGQEYIEDVGLVPVFTDGRINKFDIMAPVAIFVKSAHVFELDENGDQIWDANGDPLYQDVLNRLEFWGIVPGSDSVDKVLEVMCSDVRASIASGEVLTKSANGYNFHFNPATETFTLTAPGWGYAFSWTRDYLLVQTPS